MRGLAYLIVACGSVLCFCAAQVQAQKSDAGKAAKEPERVLRHVVLFKFKDGTTPEQTKSIEDAFRALPGKIPVIHDFEWGTNNSPEKLSQGFTHCFLLTFLSEEDRNAYLPHPAHKEFGAMLGPVLDKVCVVDYWASR
jgi:hypothetical protein